MKEIIKDLSELFLYVVVIFVMIAVFVNFVLAPTFAIGG